MSRKLILIFLTLVFLAIDGSSQEIDTLVEEGIVPVESILSNLEENTTEEVIRIIGKDSPHVSGWFFIINIILLVLLMFKYFIYGNYIKKSWNAWVNQNLFFQFIREKQPINTLLFLIEFLFKTYLFAILVLLSLTLYTGERVMELKSFIIVFFAMLAFFSLKSILVLLLSVITEKWMAFKTFNLLNTIYVANLAWFLIPLTWLVIYLDVSILQYSIYILLLIGAISLAVYAFRGYQVLKKVKMPLNVHFFTYLCAFEIVPYLILIKVLYNFKYVL